MAYADPQSVTISGTPVSLPRTSSGQNSGEFTSADGLVNLNVSHSYGGRTRRLIRLNHSKIAADPLLAGVNVRASMSVYLVVDAGKTGYSAADQKAVIDGFLAALTASSGAKVTQLLGGEN
jgi:hypothetical protein